MSRCADALRRCHKVNPAEPPTPPDPELWQRRDEFFSCEDQAAAASTQPQVQSKQRQDQQQSKQRQDQQQSKKQEQQQSKKQEQQQSKKQEQQKRKQEQQQQQQEEQPVVERRKSGGRARRVRSYLKRCRRAASSPEDQQPPPPARTSSWYVEHYHVAEQSQEHVCEEHVCELPLDKVQVLRARDLYDDSADAPAAATDADERDSAELAVAARDDAQLVRGAQPVSGRAPASVELRPGRDGPGDVLDSRTEGGTPREPVSGGRRAAGLGGEGAGAEGRGRTATSGGGELPASDGEGAEWHDARCETPEPAAPLEAPIALPESGVPALVRRHLSGVYPGFERVRAALERQARDLLVVRFQGRLAALEDLFLRPAAALAADLLLQARAQGGDAVWAAGWPLTLGARLVLHLGDVEGPGARLRAGDCYCCVRPLAGAPAVEAALVWRGGALPPPVGSPMELPAQLRALLASAERALAPDRLPLEAALFPCPAAGCGCDPPRRASVPVRDSAMQTCPLFEVAGSLPHIDSDDDDDGAVAGPTVTAAEATAAANRLTATEDRSTSTDQDCCPLVATPRSITEVPDRLLMAGITLPGTHDLKGRPLILFDSQSVARASLDRHQVATLLLYYASIPAEERLSGGVCLLVSAGGGGEAASLELLDGALSLAAAAGGPAVGCALLWRPAGRPTRPAQPADRLAASGVQYHVVSGEEALLEFVSAEQAPAVCGGRCDHDQLEWVEFHKEVEPLTALAHACGRRLVAALQEVRAGDPASRRRLAAQQRLLARALQDPQLGRLRAAGQAAVARLHQRAQWLPASQDVRLALERAERLLTEVERASCRLEALCDARRERLRDLARLRALQHESEQVLSWLCQKGEETLRRHSQLATSLPAIKEQENDFEKFYFISMRHLDKGSDLLEECSGDARGGGLRELARSLKTHLLGFSERLEDTRERLEDTSRCFCLLDKAYEWALETMKYVSRVKTGEAATAEQGLQLLRNLRQYLMAHPPIAEDHFHEMLALARKLANDKLLEQAKVAQARCQETMELIREQQTRLVRMRRELGVEDTDGEESLLLGLDQLAAASVPTTGTSTSSTTPSSSGRRRSLGAFPYIYKCSHHAEGRACSCCDPTPPPPDYASSATSGSGNSSTSGAGAAGSRLNGIREEEREGSEDGNKDEESSVSATIADDECSRCDHQQPDHPQQLAGKRPLRRACTWQYPVESFEDEGVSCTGGDDKCGYSGGGSTTDGSDGCPKNAEDLEEHDNSSGSGSKPMPPVPVNSHLHCHTSNLNIQADSAKELKTQKTLLLIMREMIQTERDYVKSLEYVIQNYIPELLREDIPQALRGQRNVIFGNIEKIFEFHSQYFLQELERCENSPLLVGQSFLRHEKKFYLYALYNKNKPKSDSLMSEYGTSFFKGKQLELGDKMDLASYLLKPVQRMGKYALLLQQLMKAYPDKESEIADIRAAEQMVRFQLRHGNDLLAMDSLRDCDVNVKEQGRLLRQNEFLVWQGKGKKCLRHVFLFEELILFSKARRFPDRKNLDLYIYKNSIKMTDIGLTAKIGDSPTKFEIWFRKRKPNDTFTLQSMSEEIKQAWTEEISKLLWKQALRNREMRLAEMSSMGIGNKPCLDIRPSADQINDRSISIAQLSKTAPRFRNSITVAPGELSRNNKRPHSIISVSSSSSSAGSNSSHGTLHLGFESVDSPRAHHRSTTLHSQCSTESGIIADMSLGSEDADASHWHVERSNSSATSVSLDSSLSPVSPTEDLKTCLEGVQMKGQETTELQSPDSGVVPDEMSVKL